MGKKPKAHSDSKLVVKAYDDLVAPSAKVVGGGLADAVATVLRPVSGLVWTVDRAFDWVSEAVVRRLQFLKPRLTTVHRPPADLEVKVLQGLQTAGPAADPSLRNMFAALLASAVSDDHARGEHCAYASVLAQLSAREAVLLAYISAAPSRLVRSRLVLEWCRVNVGPPASLEWINFPSADKTKKMLEMAPIDDDLSCIKFTPWDIENLVRLGIVDDRTVSTWEGFGPSVREYGRIRSQKEEAEASARRVAEKELSTYFGPVLYVPRHFEARVITLSKWGQAFASSVAASEFWRDDVAAPHVPVWAT